MDTLSSSVSSFTVPAASRRKSFHVKTTSISASAASSSFRLLPPRRNRFSNSRSSTTNLEFFTAVPSNAVKPHPPAAAVHRRAASGYAAALVDVAKCNNSLDAVRRDVRRMMRNEQLRAALMDPLVDNKEKGEILKEIAEKVKVHELVGGVLKILAGKNRAGLLSQVLMEFERIYDELCGTCFRISGAWKVKVSRCCLN